MRSVLVSIILTSVFSFSVFKNDAYSQSILDKTISVSFKSAAIETVIDVIQKQSKIKFMYSVTAIDRGQAISFEGKNIKLSVFFESVFKPLEIGYSIVDGKILLFSTKKDSTGKSGSQMQNNGQELSIAERVIKGKVTDAGGNPLSGASLLVKGLNIGTSTDSGGNFSLRIPSGSEAILEVSFVGYSSTTVIATGPAITIVLNEGISENTDVVVTALGISKSERRLGYATSNVNGTLLNQAKEPNVANSLTGRVSGLNINGVNGGPGSSARILIRGISNFSSSTTPLIVIDGIPMDNTQKGSPGVYGGTDMGDGISSINPDDIENIVVLKGSTASALYGPRASNGVIQVITKSGKGAKGFGVEYTANYSLNHIVDNTDYQKVFGGGLDGRRAFQVGDLVIHGLNSWGEVMDGSPVIGHDGVMHAYKPVSEQLHKFYRVAPVFINTLSFVNGGPAGNMRFSISYTDNESVIPNSNLERYSANLNVNQNITPKLKLMLMANYLKEQVKNRPFLNDMSRNPNFTMALLPANIAPATLKPGYDPVNGFEKAMNSDGYQTNPWFAAYKFITNTDRNRLISSSTLRYDFTKTLYLQTRLGVDFISDGRFEVEPTGTGYAREGKLSEQSKAQATEMNIDVLAGYSLKFLKQFNMDAAVGGNIRKYQYEKVGTSGTQWKTPFLYTVSNLAFTSPVYAFSKQQTNSAYYTLDFSFDNFLTVATTGRYDVFSTLPASHRGIFTPSISGSFLFHNFIKSKILSFGKLRASYAQTSGEATAYQTSVYYQIQSGTNNGIPFGNTVSQTTDITQLKPYRMKEFEAGLDMKWFKQRAGLSVTYFNRVTSGELISKTLGIETGYLSTYIPLGSTSNMGIELELSGTAIRKKSFEWNVSFNLTQVNNKLVSLGDSSSKLSYVIQSGQGQYRPSVGPYNNGAFVASVQGLPIAQIMAYDYAYDPKGNIIVQDGIPVRGQLLPMGSGLPKVYGGLNNQFNYKQFNLSFLVDYRFGCKVLSGTDFLSIYYGLNKKTLPGREAGVLVSAANREGETNRTLVPAQNYYQGLVKNISTISVFDGSFIKLRQVTMGYSFNSKLLRKTIFEGINVSLVARNLLTLTW